MIKEIETILKKFRSCFSRKAAFKWFVIIIFGFIVRHDFYGVSSLVRCFSLETSYYECLLHFFRADSWNLKIIIKCWIKVILEECTIVKINGSQVIISDNIKVSKEAKKMPGVKKLKQQSANSNKASYIWGHNFGVISMLIGSDCNYSAIPVKAELHEDVEKLREFQGKEIPEVKGEKKVTIHTLTVQQAINIIKITGISGLLVLDAYFAVSDPFKMSREFIENGKQMLHIITKGKRHYVGFKKKYNKNDKLIKGEKIKLKEVFKDKADEFKTKKVYVYGKKEKIKYFTMDLIWGPNNDVIRFVWVKDGDETFFLMCSDLTLTPEKIIKAYGYRYKIEVSFKFLKHVIGAFKYHFWSKELPKLKRKDGKIDLNEIKDKTSQKAIAKTTTAIERFVNIACIALGILQILAFKCPEKIWEQYDGWFRTITSQIPSIETVQNVIKAEFYHPSKEIKDSLIFKTIKKKQREEKYLYGDDSAA